jgi:putative nucleotidyltransferase with HDIG domain
MPPSLTYENQQRKWTLTVVIWVTLIASSIFTAYNLQFGSPFSLFSLFSLDLLCIVALILNYQGYYYAAAMLLSSMVLVAITLNIYDGDGLFDSGVVGYPMFIILGTLLFGKRSVIGFTLASMISLIMIGYLQWKGDIAVTVQQTDITNLIPLMIFLSVAGLLVWVIMSNMEANLRRVQRSEVEILQAYEKTLEGWGKVLEYRDAETEAHTLRVVDLSQKLARALGCSEEEVRNIRWGASLHDIGKIKIPDHILLKPEPLDPREWETMRQHPKLGKEMVDEITFLQPAVSIIYSHHERWDGCGYPQGLRGKDIPISARIFAVVDNFDALMSDRPYRDAWPSEQVIEYIRHNAGIMFDPEIVDAFLKMADTKQ